MGKRAAFGRPGVLDRLRQWWYAKDRSFQANSLLGLVVGLVAVGIVAAALAREPEPKSGLVNATRPHLTTGDLPNPPVTVDLRAAGVGTPLGVPDPSSSPSSTVATVPALPASTAPPATRPATTVTTSVRAAPTTAPAPQVIYTEVPMPPSLPQPDPTVPPLPTTTGPPTTTSTTAPPSTSPTTTVTLLPPIELPRLLP